jgi:hypothetical protein
MRFMMMIKSDSRAEAGLMPDEKLLTEMTSFNEEMAKAGVMLAGEGLQASSKGVRVRRAGGKISVIDGPFAEAKELIAGYWLVQTPSLQQAIDWARRVPDHDGEIELRRLYEMSDFPVDPSEKPEGWREQEERLREGADATGNMVARKPGTTRFMVMLKGDKLTESGAVPKQEVLQAMGALMDEMARTGAVLSGEGLRPSSEGARVKVADKKRTVLDGPFAETKELIAGYTMLQVASIQEAIDFAKRWLQIHIDHSDVDQGEIEIRQVFEMSDFPADAAGDEPDGWRQKEQRLRERLGQ